MVAVRDPQGWTGGGKSGLHRAGCRSRAPWGDGKCHRKQTARPRATVRRARVKRCGLGSTGL